MNPKQYKAMKLKYQMHHYRYYPTWKQRQRRQVVQIWSVTLAVVLITVALVLAVGKVWPV